MISRLLFRLISSSTKQKPTQLLSVYINSQKDNSLQDILFSNESSENLMLLDTILTRPGNLKRLYKKLGEMKGDEMEGLLLPMEMFRISGYFLMHGRDELDPAYQDRTFRIYQLYKASKQSQNSKFTQMEYNTFGRLLCRIERLDEGLRLFGEMQANGLKPSLQMVEEMGLAAFKADNPQVLHELIDYCRNEMDSTPTFLYNLKISMLKDHNFDSVKLIIDEMNLYNVKINAVTVNQILEKTLDFKKAEMIYNWALVENVINNTTFSIFFSICVREQRYERIDAGVREMQSCNVKPDLEAFNSILASLFNRKQYVRVLDAITEIKSQRLEMDAPIRRIYFETVIRLKLQDEDLFHYQLPIGSLYSTIQEFLSNPNKKFTVNYVSEETLSLIISIYSKRKEWHNLINCILLLDRSGIFISRDCYRRIGKILLRCKELDYFSDYLKNFKKSLDYVMLNNFLNYAALEYPQSMNPILRYMKKREFEIQLPVLESMLIQLSKDLKVELDEINLVMKEVKGKGIKLTSKTLFHLSHRYMIETYTKKALELLQQGDKNDIELDYRCNHLRFHLLMEHEEYKKAGLLLVHLVRFDVITIEEYTRYCWKGVFPIGSESQVLRLVRILERMRITRMKVVFQQFMKWTLDNFPKSCEKSDTWKKFLDRLREQRVFPFGSRSY